MKKKFYQEKKIMKNRKNQYMYRMSKTPRTVHHRLLQFDLSNEKIIFKSV